MFQSDGESGQKQDVWAVVLAGGAGSRLAHQTRRADGVVVPKQYCTLWGERSLLEATLDRLKPLVAPERTVLVVAAHHRAHWQAQRHDLPVANILAEPANRGTAVAALLALMLIRRTHLDAVVAIVPADHGVLDEAAFRRSMAQCFDQARRGCVILLGMEPDSADGGYGWIVRGESLERNHQLSRVAQFVEKPSSHRAEHLRQQGGLWASFVMVGRLGALLALVARSHPKLFTLAVTQLRKDRDFEPDHLAAFYDLIPSIDLSRDVLQALPDWLWVVQSEPCGWTDLGTPERLSHFLNARRQAPSTVSPRTCPTPAASPL